MSPQVSIENLGDHVGEKVTLRGWLYNKRSSKSLHFLILRDGSGIVQCVVSDDEVPERAWLDASSATQESGLEVVGIVREDERQVGGHEVQVVDLRLVGLAEEYP
ncbi:MAG: asparagine--tRNA ligase, partial [Rhodothermia bacterium]|nr:asparagine--tRNA ligase [Rhodothermia bacterium]